ncbi:MAG: 23S rRNA methyltransferase [Robiginitomaculum sp.]|nr:MAG: 23S rRNA methyltransferase [Robiginitomaculum sp.]
MSKAKPPSKRFSKPSVSKGKMTGSKPSGEKRGWITREAAKKQAETRMMDERVKTARGRKISSTLWLRRQLNDPYVKKAKLDGYRSRAAYKILELDEKFDLLFKGAVVVDLGAAPGGWSQIAVKKNAGKVIGIDILPVEPVAGADIIEMDFLDERAADVLMNMLGGKADLVMSDLAANTTGHRNTDHLRTVALVELAAHFAFQVLKPGGAFVTKVFQGGAEKTLLDSLKIKFETVRHAKPKSSRDGSPEMYLVAKGYKG